MKKHRDADELAARLTAAANKPPALITAPTSSSPEAEATPPEIPKIKLKAKPESAKVHDETTVPISLRPGRTLLDRYIIAASERTRKAGRVISAQQIMLEVLERGI